MEISAAAIFRSSPPPWRRSGAPRFALEIAGAVALFLALGLYRLGAHSLWLDEIMSVDFTDGAFSELFARLREDVHAPLYYFLLFANLKLSGVSEWAARLPAVLAGAATLPPLALLARRLAGARAARGALALLATSPLFLEFSREVHPYSLAALFTVLSWWALLELLRTGRRRFAALHAVCAGGLILTFYLGAFSLAAQFVFSLWAPLARRKRRRLLAAWAGGALLGALWIPGLYAQLTQSDLRGQYVIDLYFPEGLTARHTFATLGEVAFGAAAPGWNAWLAGGAALGLAGLAAWALWPFGGARAGRRARQEAWRRRAILTAFFAPLALFLFVCLFKPVLLARYLAPLAPFWALLLGAAIARARPAALAAGLAAAAALAQIAVYPVYLRSLPRQDWRGVVVHLRERMEPGDVVVADGVTARSCLAQYGAMLSDPKFYERVFTFEQFVEITGGRFPHANRSLWYLYREGISAPAQRGVLAANNTPQGQREFPPSFALLRFRGKAE